MATLIPPASQPFSLPLINGGVVYGKLSYKLKDNQSPDMLNLIYKNGLLQKRDGITSVTTSLGNTDVLGRLDRLYKGLGAFSHGTSIYTVNYDDGSTTEIYSTLTADKKGSFFIYDDVLYYLNGAEYIQYDGTTAAAVVGYIPTILINCDAATGSGTENEGINRISAGFKVSYTGTGTASTFQLPTSMLPLDATALTAVVDAVDKAETTDFTVNRTTGVVTVVGSAWTLGANTIIFTAYHTDQDATDSILECNLVMPYGGDVQGLYGGTRVFVSGNTDYPNTIYFSDTLKPDYFPMANYNYIGSNDTGVVALGKQYDLLYVFKPNSVHSVQLYFDGTDTTFTTKEVNGVVGCDMPETVQNVNNRLTWFNTYGGGYILASTDIKDERNVMPISGNINFALKDYTNAELIAASSADFDNKYWICIGSDVYVWDYGESPYLYTGNATYQDNLAWYPFDGIDALYFANIGSTLYFTRRGIGQWCKFVDQEYDYTDTAINGYWKSADWDFGYPTKRKTIDTLWFTVRADKSSSYEITYATDLKNKEDSETISVSSFSWDTVTWDTWAWVVLRTAFTLRKKPKMKKAIYFSIKIANAVSYEDLNLSDLNIQWYATGDAK